MEEEDLRKGYESPVMPRRPLHEGYTPVAMPVLPSTTVQPVQNPSPVEERK